jgi:hypothetical protein
MTAAVSSEEVVYVRYVGATEMKTPFQSHIADFSFNTGLAPAKFEETVGPLCPNYLPNYLGYTLSTKRVIAVPKLVGYQNGKKTRRCAPTQSKH